MMNKLKKQLKKRKKKEVGSVFYLGFLSREGEVNRRRGWVIPLMGF
jgi:hypothetical protein